MYLFSGVKKDCCGCMACMAVCPQGCIKLVTDEEGFEYPQREVSRCNNCKSCIAVCPLVKNSYDEQDKFSPKGYAAWSLDCTKRLASSSGGIFTVLAEQVIGEKGVVFGAAFSRDFYSVQHVKGETVDELCSFRGSKYVQSSTVGVFSLVKDCLKRGKKVLFSGTPCQVAGLRNLLDSQSSNIITCDLVCHGVPSPKVFNKYMHEQEKKYGAKTISYSFRDKKDGWHFSGVYQIFENGRTYRKSYWSDLFLNGFNKNVFLRPSCYACQFSRLPRSSDITLADYWGVETKYPVYDDNKGISLVIINSQKGDELFNSCTNQMFSEKCDLSHAVLNNIHLSHPAVEPVNRKVFFEAFKDRSFADSSRRHISVPGLLEKTITVFLKKAFWGIRIFLLRRLY